MNLCIYPGSFDPITNGHIDIIARCARVFDKVIVAVGSNVYKSTLFSVDERIELIRRSLNGIPNVDIEPFTGLLVNFARLRNATAIVKGLRALTDFEYEFQMAMMNKNLDPDIETLFMVTNNSYSYLSSSLVKEIARNKGKITGLVPDCIIHSITDKFYNIDCSGPERMDSGGM